MKFLFQISQERCQGDGTVQPSEFGTISCERQNQSFATCSSFDRVELKTARRLASPLSADSSCCTGKRPSGPDYAASGPPDPGNSHPRRSG